MVTTNQTRYGIAVDTLTQSAIDRVVWVCLGMLVLCVISGLLVRGALIQLNHEIRKDTTVWHPIIERFRS